MTSHHYYQHHKFCSRTKSLVLVVSVGLHIEVADSQQKKTYLIFATIVSHVYSEIFVDWTNLCSTKREK